MIATSTPRQRRSPGSVSTFTRPTTGAVGGYDTIAQSTAPGGQTWVRTYSRSGVLHRSDGPAYLYHRLGAASQGGVATVAAYALDGQVVGTGADAAHLGALVAAGAKAATVVGWLVVADRALAIELAGTGHDPRLVAEVASAGVADEQVVRAVLAGELPLSWAVAGALAA